MYWTVAEWFKHQTVNLGNVGSNPIGPAKLYFMDVKWLSSRSFIVGGTTYTVQVPITLDEAPIKVIEDKIKIEEDTYKMLFFLNNEEYKYTLHLKIILRVLDFVNMAYHELDYKMRYKLIPKDLD